MKKSVKINSNTFKKYPVIVIVTDHTKFNYNFFAVATNIFILFLTISIGT